ncbi:putative sulfate exporter family transporter [Aerococcaceae bacterium DSM 109653]|uniref:Putative sulfate exporter family transporter n=1 Tax=Fundicoccus ignavus TaxID=2664442 RepID=A0A844BWI6_9LACT|nr:putative sulfate exporter family transporter [Fundicoccus ignavus]
MTTIIILIIATWAALTIGGSIPLLGTSIAAILLGAIVRHTPLYSYFDSKIIKFVSKYFLKTGIVLLGFTLSLRILGQVGW